METDVGGKLVVTTISFSFYYQKNNTLSIRSKYNNMNTV